MGNVSASITQYAVQGNKRVHFGTLTMSSSYAASGDSYNDLSTFGMNVVEHLDILPVAGSFGMHGLWDSANTAIKMVSSRPWSTYVPGASALVIFGSNATAGSAVRVAPAGGAVLTNTGSIALSYIRGTFVTLHSSTSSANDYTNALATTAMGLTVAIPIYAKSSTNVPGLPLNVTTVAAGTLFTTATTNLTLPSAGASLVMLSDGGVIPIGTDTSALLGILATDSSLTGTGVRLRTTATFNISIPVNSIISFAQSQEPPAGADLSTSGANVTFRFTAVGF